MDSLTHNMRNGFSGLLSGGSSPPAAASGKREKDDDLIFCSFNQDTTSLAVGTVNGYTLYSLNSSDSLDSIYQSGPEEVYIAERLFSSSLVALVNHATPRKLRVCHFKKGTEICNYSYTSRILSVKMNRARLVVCLEESLFVHNIRDMTVLHTISETPPNKQGLCALSTDSDHCYLAYPGHSTVGELQIFDAMNLSSTRMIPAHSSQLAAVAFSPSGKRVATASEKGTVIRVFSAAEGTRLYELRRGLKRTVHIYSLSFSPCGCFLACSSNTETVHVFRMEEKPKESEVISQSPPNAGEGWMGYFNTVVSASASYLPTHVTETLLQGRAFATVHHNQTGMKNICALAVIKKTLRLLVASSDGYLYLYALNLEEGGDCSLIKQFQLTSAAAASNLKSNQDNKDLENDAKTTCGAAADISYADRVKNRETSEMTGDGVNTEPVSRISIPSLADSEKFHEMDAATETPPQQCFLLDDDGEFPPMISTVQ